MRIILALILALLCLPVYSAAETALGGLHTEDSLATIWKTMQMPDWIQARRRNGPNTDQAVLMYKRQGSVYVGLTPVGDKLEHMLTESPGIATNDGIKVGDPQSAMLDKRGQPEEKSHDQAGITENWYWSQGINFAIDDKSSKIVNIFIFPPMKAGEQLQEIDVPTGTFEVSHGYTGEDKQSAIVGRVSNKSDKPQFDVRVGITLYDEERKVVDVLVSDIGCLMPGSAFPFKAGVERKGEWTDYSIDFVAGDISDARAKQFTRTAKSGLAGRTIVVIPVSQGSEPQ